MTARAVRIPHITWEDVSIFAPFAFAAILLLNCIWYGGDTASILGGLLIAMAWIAVNTFMRRKESSFSSELTKSGRALGVSLTIVLSIIPLFICLPSGDDVLIVDNSTSLSNWVFFRTPFVTSQVTVPLAFDGATSDPKLSSKFYMSANGTRHGFLEVNVQTTGLVLDTENPSIEQTFLRETAIRPVDISDQLKIRINEAVKTELATWPLSRFDQTGDQFVLDNAVANRIIASAHLNKLGVRWKDGMITISAQLHFNS